MFAEAANTLPADGTRPSDPEAEKKLKEAQKKLEEEKKRLEEIEALFTTPADVQPLVDSQKQPIDPATRLKALAEKVEQIKREALEPKAGAPGAGSTSPKPGSVAGTPALPPGPAHELYVELSTRAAVMDPIAEIKTGHIKVFARINETHAVVKARKEAETKKESLDKRCEDLLGEVKRLRGLIQAERGRAWGTPGPPEAVRGAHGRFVDHLWAESDWLERRYQQVREIVLSDPSRASGKATDSLIGKLVEAAPEDKRQDLEKEIEAVRGQLAGFLAGENADLQGVLGTLGSIYQRAGLSQSQLADAMPILQQGAKAQRDRLVAENKANVDALASGTVEQRDALEYTPASQLRKLRPDGIAVPGALKGKVEPKTLEEKKSRVSELVRSGVPAWQAILSVLGPDPGRWGPFGAAVGSIKSMMLLYLLPKSEQTAVADKLAELASAAGDKSSQIKFELALKTLKMGVLDVEGMLSATTSQGLPSPEDTQTLLDRAAQLLKHPYLGSLERPARQALAAELEGLRKRIQSAASQSSQKKRSSEAKAQQSLVGFASVVGGLERLSAVLDQGKPLDAASLARVPKLKAELERLAGLYDGAKDGLLEDHRARVDAELVKTRALLEAVQTRSLAAAYAGFNRSIIEMIETAPYKFSTGAEAYAEWAKNWEQFKRRMTSSERDSPWGALQVLWDGATESGQQGARGERAKAEALRKLLAAMQENNFDPGVLEPKMRALLLGKLQAGQGGASEDATSELGLIGQALVKQTDAQREFSKKLYGAVEKLKALGLKLDGGDGDAQALAAFFDNADNRAMIQGTELEPLVNQWRDSKARADASPGKPGAAESYQKLAAGLRFLIPNVDQPGTERTRALLYMRHYNLNESVYEYLKTQATEKERKEHADFMAEFEAARGAGLSGTPTSEDLRKQQRLSDKVRDLLRNFPEYQAMMAVQAANSQLADALKEMLEPDNAEERKLLEKAGAPDLRNLSQRAEKSTVIQWVLTAQRLGLVSAGSPEWKAMSDQVLSYYYGPRYDATLKAQSETLRGHIAAIVKARETGDGPGAKKSADELMGVLDGMVSPVITNPETGKTEMFVTSGFLREVPRLVERGAKGRMSTRDQTLLQLWQGDGEPSSDSFKYSLKGTLSEQFQTYQKLAGVAAVEDPAQLPPADDPGLKSMLQYLGGISRDDLVGILQRPRDDPAVAEARKVLAQMREQFGGSAKIMRDALDDPADPEKLAEALRLAGYQVYDARLLGVAMDPGGVPKEPGSGDVAGRRSLAALRQLEAQFGKTGGNPSNFLGFLLEDLGGGKATAYENARRDQLLMSTNDETQDAFRKLGALVNPVKDDQDLGPDAKALNARALALARSLGESDAFQQLRNAVASQLTATDRLEELAWSNERSSGGRLRQRLAADLSLLQAQSQAAIRDKFAEDGLAVSGWLIGRRDDEVAVRRRAFNAPESDSISPSSRPRVKNQLTGDDIGPPEDPSDVDGIQYVKLKGGRRSDDYEFVALDGSYRRVVGNASPAPLRPRAAIGDGDLSIGENDQFLALRDSRGRTVYAKVDEHGKPVGEYFRLPLADNMPVEFVSKADLGSVRHLREVAVTTYDKSGGSVGYRMSYYQAQKGDRVVMPAPSGYNRAGQKTIWPGASQLGVSEVKAVRDPENPKSDVVAYEGVMGRTGNVVLAVTRVEGDRTVKVDYEAGTQFVREGKAGWQFRLSDDWMGTSKDGNRTYMTFDANNVATAHYTEFLQKDPKGQTYSMMRTVLDDPSLKVKGASIVPTYKVFPGAGESDVRDRFAAERKGQKTAFAGTVAESIAVGFEHGPNAALDSQRFSQVAGHVKRLLGEDRAKFQDNLAGLMALYDGQVQNRKGVDGTQVFDARFNFGSGGTVGVSLRKYNHDTQERMASDALKFRYVPLPEKPGETMSGRDTIQLREEMERNKDATKLKGVRDFTGGEFAFVEFAEVADVDNGGKPRSREKVVGFVGKKEGGSKYGRYDVDLGDEYEKGGLGPLYGADIKQDVVISGNGELWRRGYKVGTAASVWNFAGKIGDYANNAIVYSDFGEAHPMWAAVLGGLAGGIIEGALDPTSWLAIGAMAKLGKALQRTMKVVKSLEGAVEKAAQLQKAQKRLQRIETAMKAVEKGFKLMQYNIIIQSAPPAIVGLVTQDPRQFNQGVRGLSMLLPLNKFQEKAMGIHAKAKGEIEGPKGKDIEVPGGRDVETPGSKEGGRSSDVDTRRSGDVDTRRSGDVDTRRSGDVDTRRPGDVDTRRPGGLDPGRPGENLGPRDIDMPSKLPAGIEHPGVKPLKVEAPKFQGGDAVAASRIGGDGFSPKDTTFSGSKAGGERGGGMGPVHADGPGGVKAGKGPEAGAAPKEAAGAPKEASALKGGADKPVAAGQNSSPKVEPPSVKGEALAGSKLETSRSAVDGARQRGPPLELASAKGMEPLRSGADALRPNVDNVRSSLDTGRLESSRPRPNAERVRGDLESPGSRRKGQAEDLDLDSRMGGDEGGLRDLEAGRAKPRDLEGGRGARGKADIEAESASMNRSPDLLPGGREPGKVGTPEGGSPEAGVKSEGPLKSEAPGSPKGDAHAGPEPGRFEDGGRLKADAEAPTARRGEAKASAQPEKLDVIDRFLDAAIKFPEKVSSFAQQRFPRAKAALDSASLRVAGGYNDVLLKYHAKIEGFKEAHPTLTKVGRGTMAAVNAPGNLMASVGRSLSAWGAGTGGGAKPSRMGRIAAAAGDFLQGTRSLGRSPLDFSESLHPKMQDRPAFLKAAKSADLPGGEGVIHARTDPASGRVLEYSAKPFAPKEGFVDLELKVRPGEKGGFEIAGMGVSPSSKGRPSERALSHLDYQLEVSVRDDLVARQAQKLMLDPSFTRRIKAGEDPLTRASDMEFYWDKAKGRFSLEPVAGAAKVKVTFTPYGATDIYRVASISPEGRLPLSAVANLKTALSRVAGTGIELAPGALRTLGRGDDLAGRQFTPEEAGKALEERLAANRERLKASEGEFRGKAAEAQAELEKLRLEAEGSGDWSKYLARARELQPELARLSRDYRDAGGNAEYTLVEKARKDYQAATRIKDPELRRTALDDARAKLAAAQKEADLLGIGKDLRAEARERLFQARDKALSRGVDPDALDSQALYRRSLGSLEAARTVETELAARLSAARGGDPEVVAHLETELARAKSSVERAQAELAAARETLEYHAGKDPSLDPRIEDFLARTESLRKSPDAESARQLEAELEALPEGLRAAARKAGAEQVLMEAYQRQYLARYGREGLVESKTALADAEAQLREMGVDLEKFDGLQAQRDAVELDQGRLSEHIGRSEDRLASLEKGGDAAAVDAARAELERFYLRRAELHEKLAGVDAELRRSLDPGGAGDTYAARDLVGRRAQAKELLSALNARSRADASDMRILRAAANESGLDAKSLRARAEYLADLQIHDYLSASAAKTHRYRLAGMTAGQADAAASLEFRRARGKVMRGEVSGGERVEYQGAEAMTCALHAYANNLKVPYAEVEAHLRSVLGEGFVEKVRAGGMSPAEVTQVGKVLGLAYGRELKLVRPGDVFSMAAAGKDVMVVINYGADGQGVGGGPHMINIKASSIRTEGGSTRISLKDSGIEVWGKKYGLPVEMDLKDFVRLMTRSGGYVLAEADLSAATKARYVSDASPLVRRFRGDAGEWVAGAGKGPAEDGLFGVVHQITGTDGRLMKAPDVPVDDGLASMRPGGIGAAGRKQAVDFEPARFEVERVRLDLDLPPFLKGYPPDVTQPLLSRMHTDYMTKARNNRFLETHAGQIAEHYGEVVMFDGDSFGSVNRALRARFGDTVGGQMADEVLARLIGRAQAAVDSTGSGLVVRKGGEEIVIFAPKGKGAMVAERIRQAGEYFHAEKLDLGDIMARYKESHGIDGTVDDVMSLIRQQALMDARAKAGGDNIDAAAVKERICTISAGVAKIERPAGGDALESLNAAIKRADGAVEAAKKGGKNKVGEAGDGGKVSLLAPGARVDPGAFTPQDGRAPWETPAFKEALAKLSPADRAMVLESIHTDPLTRLGNRESIRENLPSMLSRYDALYKVEIDNFKAINDHPQLGHDVGDAVLSEFGRVALKVRAEVARELGLTEADLHLARDYAKEFHFMGRSRFVDVYVKRFEAALADGDGLSLVRAAARVKFGQGKADFEPTGEQLGQVRRWIAEQSVKTGKDPSRVGTVTGKKVDLDASGVRDGKLSARVAYDRAAEDATAAVETVKNDRNARFLEGKVERQARDIGAPGERLRLEDYEGPRVPGQRTRGRLDVLSAKEFAARHPDLAGGLDGRATHVLVDPARPGRFKPLEAGDIARLEGVPLEKYFSFDEFAGLHPKTVGADIYHDWRHSLRVSKMAQDLAVARGLKADDAAFLREVALLHDLDPGRDPGKAARVPSTLERLQADFEGKLSLTGEEGASILRDRFGWDERKLKLAMAMIQRTEFPFGPTHPSPAYKDAGPLARYESMLRSMSPEDQRFVLQEGALLSEYADKSSWYSTESFEGAFKVVKGLVNEINTGVGKPVMDMAKLDTHDFLSKVGVEESFRLDLDLAQRLGLDGVRLMGRAEAFDLLPGQYRRTFESNLKGFESFKKAMAGGSAAPDLAAAELELRAFDIAVKEAAKGRLLGEPAKIDPGEAPENIAALARQNEAARILYENGYEVWQNGVNAGADFKLNGREFDCYAPTTDKPRNIWGTVKGKIVVKHQGRGVVLALDGSKVTLEALGSQFADHPIKGLEDLLVIRDGRITTLMEGGRVVGVERAKGPVDIGTAGETLPPGLKRAAESVPGSKLTGDLVVRFNGLLGGKAEAAAGRTAPLSELVGRMVAGPQAVKPVSARAPESYRRTLLASKAPEVAVTRVISEEGSSAVVYEGVLDGRKVAVKTYHEPIPAAKESLGEKGAWDHTLAYFREEVGLAREMSRVLGSRGLAPKVFGEVDIGPNGNPSWAMEVIVGKSLSELTPAEARVLITPKTLAQASEGIELLRKAGLGGADSPQAMVLTRDQVINGVARKAGDVVFMDPGGLTRDPGIWKSPLDMAKEVAWTKARADLAGDADLHRPVESLPFDDAIRSAVKARVDRLVEPLGGKPAGILPGASGRPLRLAAPGEWRTSVPGVAEIGAAGVEFKTVGQRGSDYYVDGVKARSLGFGNFKETFVHPKDPEAVLKLFNSKSVMARGESIIEKRLEHDFIKRLEPLGVVPRLLSQGAVAVEGKPVGYIVQERVAGRTLDKVSADQLPHVRKLFDILAKNGILMADFERPLKWRDNIMVGTTRSGGLKAYLVDADITLRHGKSPAELKAIYDRLYRSIDTRPRTVSDIGAAGETGAVEDGGRASRPLYGEGVGGRGAVGESVRQRLVREFAEKQGLKPETVDAAINSLLKERGFSPRMLDGLPPGSQKTQLGFLLNSPDLLKQPGMGESLKPSFKNFNARAFESAKRSFTSDGSYGRMIVRDGGELARDGMRLYRHIQAQELARILADNGLIPKAFKEHSADFGSVMHQMGGAYRMVELRVIDNPKAKDWIYEYTAHASRSGLGASVTTAGNIKIEIVPRAGQEFIDTNPICQKLWGKSEQGWATIDPIAIEQIRLFGPGCENGCSLASEAGRSLAARLLGR